jgi:thiol-disulfide isomerase/thioredoxin
MDRTFVLVLLLILLVVWFGSSESLVPGRYLWQRLTFNRGDDLRVVLFKANWCHVCQRLSRDEWPRLKAEFRDVKFEEVDCDSNKDLCMQYGIGSFPTILIMKNGIPVPYRGSWRYEEMVVELRRMLK